MIDLLAPPVYLIKPPPGIAPVIPSTYSNTHRISSLAGLASLNRS